MAADRLFVALSVPAHVRALGVAACAPARTVAPDLTWTRPEGWHVTLAFLGAVDEVDAVAGAVGAAVAGAPIDLALGAAGAFGDRVLWLRVEDDPRGAVARLGADLQRSLVTAGLLTEQRRVRPHLTLARASGGARVDAAVVEAVAPVTARWEADEVHLMRSVTGRGPARYEPVAAWPLSSAGSSGRSSG